MHFAIFYELWVILFFFSFKTPSHYQGAHFKMNMRMCKLKCHGPSVKARASKCKFYWLGIRTRLVRKAIRCSTRQRRPLIILIILFLIPEKFKFTQRNFSEFTLELEVTVARIMTVCLKPRQPVAPRAGSVVASSLAAGCSQPRHRVFHQPRAGSTIRRHVNNAPGPYWEAPIRKHAASVHVQPRRCKAYKGPRSSLSTRPVLTGSVLQSCRLCRELSGGGLGGGGGSCHRNAKSTISVVVSGDTTWIFL